MKKYLILLILTLSVLNVAFAQQDAQFSHYMFNSLYYNPGSAGIDGQFKAYGIFRKQWLGYRQVANNVVLNDAGGESPTSAIIGVSSRLPILNDKVGMGAHLAIDDRGNLRNYEVQLSIAYHIKIAQGLLGIGVRPGLYFSSVINKDWYKVNDTDDKIYQGLVSDPNYQNITKFDFAGGLWYQSTKWYAGVGVNHIPKAQFNSTPDMNSVLNYHMYINGGYTFKLSPTMDLTPATVVQTDFKQVTFVLGPQLMYNSKYWLGVHGRQSFARSINAIPDKVYNFDSFIINIGASFMKNNAFKIGYALDIETTGVAAKSGTSHEFFLQYTIPAPGSTPRPVIRTPRYRHEEN